MWHLNRINRKKKTLSLLTHPHIRPNPNNLLSAMEHTIRHNVAPQEDP